MNESTLGTFFIPQVTERVTCGKHRADIGEPCYSLGGLNKRHSVTGVCNKRARKAGYEGKISRTSLGVR